MRRTAGPILAAVSIALLASGCFSVRQVDVKAGVMDFRTDYAPGEIASRMVGPVAVHVVATPSFGCHLVEVPPGSAESKLGTYRCKPLPLRAGNEEELIVEGAAKDPKSIGAGFLFSGLGHVVRDCLDEQLVRQGFQPSVQLVESKTSGAELATATVDYYQDWWATGPKHAEITLVAQPADGGAPLTATGKATHELGNSHLGWLIPLGVLTFPIGVVVGKVILNSMEDGMAQRAIGEAIDLAAEDLAVQMGKRRARTAAEPTPWRVSALIR